MKILLTGATGFLGYRTLEKLVKLNNVTTIIATGRTLLPYRKIEDAKVIYKLGSLEDKNFVNDLFGEVDVVINTASLSSPWGSAEEFDKANILTQSNLIKASEANGVKRFIYVSTPSLYYNGKDRFDIKESEPLPKKFINHYARTKREAEILLEKSSLPYIILRPKALIGRGDTTIMPRVIRAHDEGKLRIIGNGKNLIDLTSVENVVDSILLSLYASEQALNQTYNISNGNPVLIWERIKNILNALGRPMKRGKIPYKLLYFIALFLELKSKLTNKKEPALTAYGVSTLGLSFTLDITKAQNLLKYNPSISTEQALKEFVKWYSESTYKK